MNDEDYEHAMDVAFAERDADVRMWLRGGAVADFVEPLMPWLRIDDGFMEHPKIVGLSDRAFRLHVAALVYCARFSTDGAVNSPTLLQLRRNIGGTYATRFTYIQELIDAQLWTKSGDGVVIHDFLEYNPDAASVKESRERNAERQQRFREKRNAVTNGVTDDDVTPLVTAPRPDPYKERLYEERKPPKRVTHSTGDPDLDAELGWDRQP